MWSDDARRPRHRAPYRCLGNRGEPRVGCRCRAVFPRDDVVSLAAKLASLLDDPVRRRELGVMARERAESLTWLRTWEGVVGAARSDESRPVPLGGRVHAV